MSAIIPEHLSPRTASALRRRQSGLGLIMAIFILVVLAGLAAGITSFTSLVHMGKALDEQGAQAYQAARAGTEWAALHLLKMPAPWPCATAPGVNSDLVIEGWAVTVNCTELAAGNTVEKGLGALYQITATSCAPAAAGQCPGPVTGSNHYVERSLRTLIERPAP